MSRSTCGDGLSKIYESNKMNKCPKCGKEINKLINIQEVYVLFDFKLEKKEVVYCNRKEDISDSIAYCCPECRYEITGMEEDAVEFLKEKKQ